MARIHVALILMAGMLSGCAAGTSQMYEYTGKDSSIYKLVLPGTDLEGLEVKMHPTDQRRAWVAPTTGDALAQGFVKGQNQWIVRVGDFKEIYSKVLVDHLAKRQMTCSILQADPYPAYFAFDFRFRCARD